MTRTRWANRKRARHTARWLLALLVVCGGLLSALSWRGAGGGTAFAGTLNTAQLDNGTCGHNLPLGSAPTASSSARPWFLPYGDGGTGSYALVIGAGPDRTLKVRMIA